MVGKPSLVFLTVIHLSVAFEFQNYVSPTFSPKKFNHPSTENKEVQIAVSDLKEQEKRLSKQRQLLDQQLETLKVQDTQIKEQGERIGAQNQLLSEAIVSQKEVVVRLSNVEEKLKRLEAGGRVTKEHHGGNFTSLEEVGLSFALIKTTVQNWEMEEYCREMVEGGRLVVLDSKPKYEALRDYMNENVDEGTPFYIGLKLKRGEKIPHWSNGKPIDDNFWCSGPGSVHASAQCTALKRHPVRGGYCIGGIPCTRGRIICEKP